MLQKVVAWAGGYDKIEILVIEGNSMKTKAVIAAHLHKGQRVAIGGREGFYLIQSVERRGPYVDIEVQGSFWPISLPLFQVVRVKL